MGPFSAQVLEEKPQGALDLLDTSYLIKRTAFDAKESSPLVPISVRLRVGQRAYHAALLVLEGRLQQRFSPECCLQSAADAAKAVATATLFGCVQGCMVLVPLL